MVSVNTEGALRLDSWEQELPFNDPKREFILSGIKDGFHIVDSLGNQNVEVNNYKSATCLKNRDSVENQILEEIGNGRYQIVSEKPQIVSAIGAIPKKGTSKVRLIHDCSRPTGHALNDFANNDPFHYQTIQDAVDLVQSGCFLAKVDLSNAYRSVKIHPSNFKATGLKWTFKGHDKPTYLVDRRMPFGASRSPYIFTELGRAVQRIMKNKGFSGLVIYLDDFFVVGATWNECNQALHLLMGLLRKLGFAINYNKVEGPSRNLTFLGIKFDTVNMTLELPREKILQLQGILEAFRNKSKISKRALQSLAGKLNFATQCIYGGRFYLRRIYSAIAKLRNPWHRVRVTREMKADIQWWLDWMTVFNGQTPMIDPRPSTPLFIDACQAAAGATYKDQFVYTPWSWYPDANGLHINFKEAIALEPALNAWAPLFQNKKVQVHCDNQAAVAIINRGTCSNQTVMASLRRIFWLSALYNFRINAVYHPGIENTMADAVSRLHERNNPLRPYLLPYSSAFR